MLDICAQTGKDLGIKFNGLKSKCIHFGPAAFKNPPDLTLDNHTIPWVDKIKYLGILIKSDVKFAIDASDCRCKYFVSVNTIMSKCSLACDMVKLKILESQCLPILLYGSETEIFDEHDMC